MEKWEIPVIIKYLFLTGSLGREIETKINMLYGRNVINTYEVSQWLSKFFRGDYDVTVHPMRCGKKWDDVQWSSQQQELAERVVESNSFVKCSERVKETLEREASQNWDKFYSQHKNKFFKDRHWLHLEFPELNFENGTCDNKIKIFEIGCGTGNTVVPLLQMDHGKSLFVYACDFSERAVDILKEHPLYNESNCQAFMMDVTSDEWIVPFPENSLDVVTLIFVLSAITPTLHSHVLKQIKKYLKPGGLVMFRDYARYDMTQLRFKCGACLDENYYTRGDGTLVYYTTTDEVRTLFVSEGFKEEKLALDRRLQVNRSKLKKMYRVWILAKFRKVEEEV